MKIKGKDHPWWAWLIFAGLMLSLIVKIAINIFYLFYDKT